MLTGEEFYFVEWNCNFYEWDLFVSCINPGIYLRYLLDWILKQNENGKQISKKKNYKIT